MEKMAEVETEAEAQRRPPKLNQYINLILKT